MSTKALVLKITGDNILVTPVLSESCSGCKSECGKRKDELYVSNPGQFELKEGSVVNIKSSAKAQAIQGLLSLFVPFLSAISGYFVSTPLYALLNKKASDGIKALFVLIFLFVSSLCVFIITRKYPLPGKPEIVSVE